jgi:hypothetical protein
MQLDPRTLLMTLTISTALLGFYLVFYQATRKTYTGFRMWVFGTVLMGIGALLLAFRGEVPTGLSIVLGNVAYPAGGVFLLLGTKRFLELPSPGKTLWAIPLITMLGLSFFYWVYDLAAIRGMVMSLGLASVGLPTAWLLWRHAPDSSKALYYFTSFAMAIANIALPARSLIWWIVDPEVQLLTQHAFQTIYLFIAMFAQITWTFGFVMMNSQRLEDDLRQSRSDLSEANQYLEKAPQGGATVGRPVTHLLQLQENPRLRGLLAPGRGVHLLPFRCPVFSQYLPRLHKRALPRSL